METLNEPSVGPVNPVIAKDNISELSVCPVSTNESEFACSVVTNAPNFELPVCPVTVNESGLKLSSCQVPINESNFELSVCPFTVKESGFKLSSCPVPVNDLNLEFSDCPALIRKFPYEPLSHRDSGKYTGNVLRHLFPDRQICCIHTASDFPESVRAFTHNPWRHVTFHVTCIMRAHHFTKLENDFSFSTDSEELPDRCFIPVYIFFVVWTLICLQNTR